jgi:hypothetical protein
MKEVAFGENGCSLERIACQGSTAMLFSSLSLFLGSSLVLVQLSLKHSLGYLALSHCSPYIIDKYCSRSLSRVVL